MLVKTKRAARALALSALCAFSLGLGGCRADPSAQTDPPAGPTEPEGAAQAVHFDRELDGYGPRKDEYNFYFTYKTVHPWWDAVALGMEDAARLYEKLGVVIN